MEYKLATKDDIELMMKSRLEMLKVVNNLPQDYQYSDEIVKESREYFLNGDRSRRLRVNELHVDNAHVFASDGKEGAPHERLHEEQPPPSGDRAQDV